MYAGRVKYPVNLNGKSTENLKEEIIFNASKELLEILSQKESDEYYPSSEYINLIIQSVNSELESLERKQRIGLFIAFSTIEVGVFFLLTFSQFSDLFSKRILGPASQGGYGFWEGILEPVAFRIILMLILTIVSVSVTLKLFSFFSKKVINNYFSTNISLILLFNIVTMIVFLTAWWGLVWIDRLTSWL